MIEGARVRARREVVAAITGEARRQLGAVGPDGLSLRAVARELGMVSSALYRYFSSRDELLTALIIEAYDALGATAEQALNASAGSAPPARWLAVCRAVRTWAIDHPHEYALIYGSPVPGYTAPEDTIAPAARVGLALIEVVRDAHARGELAVMATAVPGVLRGDAERLLGTLSVDLPLAAVPVLVAAWAQLFGLVGFELFGQFENVVDAREEFFDLAAGRLGAQVGLAAG